MVSLLLLSSFTKLITEKSAPEHHHNLEFLPLRRPSFSTFLYLQAVSSPPTAGLLQPARARSVPPALRGPSRPECRQTRPTKSAPETTNFTLESAPEPHNALGHIFHFAVAHSRWYQKMWVECSSVASFLVLGGGGKTPKINVPTEEKNVHEYARASASETYIFSGLTIHLYTLLEKRVLLLSHRWNL